MAQAEADLLKKIMFKYLPCLTDTFHFTSQPFACFAQSLSRNNKTGLMSLYVQQQLQLTQVASGTTGAYVILGK